MHSISLGARGSRKHPGSATVWMTTGDGNEIDGQFCLTPSCTSAQEIDYEIKRLTGEIQEWGKKAKAELKKRNSN